MKKIILLISVCFILFSCESKKDKAINESSSVMFEYSADRIKSMGYNVNIDSFRIEFEKLKIENPTKGLEFAKRFGVYYDKLRDKKQQELDKKFALIEKRYKENKIKDLENQKVWENSKYGKLQKKHPEWTDDECMKVYDKKIWIGMTYDMLVYQRGKPNRINPSNYGRGTKYQCCWDNYTPSCFYMRSDNIIYAFN